MAQTLRRVVTLLYTDLGTHHAGQPFYPVHTLGTPVLAHPPTTGPVIANSVSRGQRTGPGLKKERRRRAEQCLLSFSSEKCLAERRYSSRSINTSDMKRTEIG